MTDLVLEKDITVTTIFKSVSLLSASEIYFETWFHELTVL